VAEPVRRLFFALWPDAQTRAALDQAALALAGKRIRRIPAHNLHLTLAFAGRVNAAVQSCLETQATGLQLAGFDLCIDRCGHYARPRIEWLAPAHTPSALWDLATALRTVLVSCGLEPEARMFQAHLTIARRVAQPLPERSFAPVHWSVGAFSLVESVPSDNGVQYVPLRSWMLEGRSESMG
jgi:2'-5' RNA ligase